MSGAGLHPGIHPGPPLQVRGWAWRVWRSAQVSPGAGGEVRSKVRTNILHIWDANLELCRLAFTKNVNAFSKSFFLLFENKVEDFIDAWYLHVNASMHQHRHWSRVPDTFPLCVTEICHAGQVLKSPCTVYIFTSEWNKSFDSKF